MIFNRVAARGFRLSMRIQDRGRRSAILPVEASRRDKTNGRLFQRLLSTRSDETPPRWSECSQISQSEERTLPPVDFSQNSGSLRSAASSRKNRHLETAAMAIRRAARAGGKGACSNAQNCGSGTTRSLCLMGTWSRRSQTGSERIPEMSKI